MTSPSCVKAFALQYVPHVGPAVPQQYESNIQEPQATNPPIGCQQDIGDFDLCMASLEKL
jgi:hypothetical protein